MIKFLDILKEDIEIKNIQYYQNVLDKSNGLSIESRRFFQSVINSIKKRNNMATDKQAAKLADLVKGRV
jgi:hypothetical protein